jgi:hypothetical protein
MVTTQIAVGLWRGCRDLLGLLVHRDDDPLRYTANENTLSRLATTASRVKPVSKQGLKPNGLAKTRCIYFAHGRAIVWVLAFSASAIPR